MKFIIILLLFCGSASAQKLKPPLEPFRFLIGSWEMKTTKGRLVEQWSYADPSALNGISYRINSTGDTTILENVRITLRGANLFYIPTVTDQNQGKSIKFKLISSLKGIFIFENKVHDFPQRIVYQPKSENELVAWIEGNVKGKTRKSEYLYQRIIE